MHLSRRQGSGADTYQISNIFYSDENTFIWLPLLVNSCWAAVQRQLAAKLLLTPSYNHNLGGLKISLYIDQGHIKIVLNILLLIVHVCPGAKLEMAHRSERPGQHKKLELVLH